MGHSTDASAMVSRHRDPNVGKIVNNCTYSLNEPRGKRKRQTLSIIIVIIVVGIIITIIIIARCHFFDCNVMIPRMMRINDSDNNHYLVNPIINLPFGDNTSKKNMVRLGIVTVYSWDYHLKTMRIKTYQNN
jgi:hypothetical protein